MKKEEIKKYVAARNNTVLNFPDRGPWGNNRYRGNCSGWVIGISHLEIWREVSCGTVCRRWHRI